MTKFSLYFQSNENGNKTEFIGMNLDCVMLVLERLGLPELLNVARINDEFGILAVGVFRRKYSHLQVLVEDDFEFPEEPSELNRVTGAFGQIFRKIGIIGNEMPQFDVTESHIQLDGYDTIVNTFKCFGQAIRKLKFTTSFLYHYSTEKFVAELISNFTSDSLVDVEFADINEKLLTYISKPLVGVETVRMSGVHLGSLPNGFPLNELFPNVRRLDLSALSGDHLDYFNCHIPNLEHFSINGIIARNGNNQDETYFTTMIQQNPQIQSIDFYGTDSKLLRLVNTQLSHLDALGLSQFDMRAGHLQFENVTKLSIHSEKGSPENLHFPRLQTLYANVAIDHFDEWQHFLNEHSHLTRVHLKYFNLNNAQFQQLTANLGNVEEFTLDHRTDRPETQKVKSTAIAAFLRSHAKVQRINVINFPDYTYRALKHQLDRAWDSTIIKHGVSFKRRATWMS